MADNVVRQIKDLDEYINKADKSLQTLVQRYERLEKAQASKDQNRIAKNIDLVEKGTVTLISKLNTLETKLKQLYKTAGNTAEVRRLSLAIKELTSSGGKFPSILEKIRNNRQGVGDFGSKEMKETVRAISSADRALRSFRNAQKDVSRGFKDMLPTIQKFGSAFGMAFSIQGIVQFGRKLIETRGEFEMQQVALRSILQNKQLADEIWDKTMQAALMSPFTAMQLTRYTKQLAAYRIETEKLFDTTKMLADVSAGLGVDMQRLILAYGQVKAANYLRASEIRQFTEAGVNILGELSTYLSQTRGEFISTAQVMDMVQKRMVKFEDVEAIFHRMTDEGGIFYNMQYVQSQTVKGQINKLHDAYDQMLNSIGKANQGVMRDMVAALNNLVQNWRTVAVVLKTIGWSAAIGFASKFAFQLIGVQKASTSTLRTLVKLKQGIQGLSVAFKANLPMLAVTGITALVTALISLDKRMKQVNSDIDEQNLRLYETQEKLSNYQNKIESNNKALENNRGTEEELAKKRRENAEILAKLKSDYPQLSEGMKLQKNGVVDLTDALKEENKELERQILLNSQMKQQSIFDDNFIKDSSDLAKKYMKQYNLLVNIREEARRAMLNTDEDSPYRDILKDIIDLDPSDIQNSFNKLYDIQKTIYDYYYNKRIEGGKATFSLYHKYLYGSSLANLSAASEEKELKREYDKVRGTLEYLIEQSVEKFYGDELHESGLDAMNWYALNVDRIQRDVENGVNDFYKTIRIALQNNGQANSPGIREFVNGYFTENIIQPIQNGYKALATTVENFGILPPLRPSGKPDVLAEYNKGGGDGSTETPEEKKAKSDAAWRRRISLLEEMRKRYEELSKSAYGYAMSEAEVRKAFGDVYKDGKLIKKGSFSEIFGGTGITMDQIDFTSAEAMVNSMELALSRAKGISAAVREEIMKKIDSLRTTITIDAKVRIREDLGRQMEAALNNYELTIDLENLNLPKGLAAELWGVDDTTLEDLRAKLSYVFTELKDKNGELYKEAFKDYQNYLKKVDDLERKQQRERLKEYSKYLEYQYSERAKIEMEYIRKLADLESVKMGETQKAQVREGLRKDFEEKSRKQDWEDFKGSEFYVQMMEDLERQSTASLTVMKEKLLEMRSNAENLSPRALKEVIRALEKIEEIEYGRKEPLKRYRDALKALGDSNAIENFKRLAEAQRELGDIEQQERALNEMIMLEQERNRLKSEGIELDDEEAKKQLDIARKTLIAYRNERINFKSSGSKEDENRLADLLERENMQGQIVLMYENMVNALSSGRTIEGFMKDNQFNGLGLDILFGKKEELQEDKSNILAVISLFNQWVNKYREAKEAEDKLLEATKTWAQNTVTLYDSVIDTIDFFTDKTYGMTAAWKEFGDTSVASFNELISGIQTYRKAQAQWEKDHAEEGISRALINGDTIRLIMVALGALLKIIQAVSKLRDSYNDKTIQKQQEKIDALTRAYERLERQIEKTFAAASYMSEFNKQTENLREQIAALEAQRAAEEAKKNTDKSAVQSYTDAIQDAYDKLEDLQQEQIEVFGGVSEKNFRSVAEGFVEAWKEAFLETGDGLQALQDHFEEFLQDWFVKQATMQGVAEYYKGVFDYINGIVKDGSVPTQQQIEHARQLADEAAANSDALMRAMAGVFGLGADSGGLSGLAAGIQGMTEEQANILEAYWNSVRRYTESIDMNVARIASILGAGGVNTNPQLQQLQLIAVNTQATHQLLQSTAKSGHPQGGYGFKVFND